MKSVLCKHCLPSKRKGHFSLHLEFYLEKLPKIHLSFSFLDSLFLEFFALLGIVKFEYNIERKLFYNRSLIFWDEAKKRGLDISALKVLGRYTNEFRLIYSSRKYYFEGTPLNIFPAPGFIDNKIKAKEMLIKNEIPVASGRKFTSPKKAEKYAKILGFPLVVKPNAGSLSHHITTCINSIKDFRKAVGIAKIYRPDFIIEKFIKGKLYRVTVIGKKYVFVCQKELANVKGNGVSTIAELILKKNNDPKRGDAGVLSATLHKIPVNNVTLAKLRSVGLILSSVPAKGQKIYVQNKYILSAGCDVIDCSAKVHPVNKKLFLKIAEVFSSEVLGVDFICNDIKKSFKEQTCAVLETNSLPYLDMHQFPSYGHKINIAKYGWDTVLLKLKGSA